MGRVEGRKDHYRRNHTGIGDPVYDDRRYVISRIQSVKLTKLSKAQLIQRLIVAIEHLPVNHIENLLG